MLNDFLLRLFLRTRDSSAKRAALYYNWSGTEDFISLLARDGGFLFGEVGVGKTEFLFSMTMGIPEGGEGGLFYSFVFVFIRSS